MTTIQHLQAIIPGQTAAWYSRIATEIDAGRMPMPNPGPTAVTTKPTAVTTKPTAVTTKPTAVTTKPTAVSKDYTVPILKAIGFGLLTSYFVMFVSTFVLVGTAVASFTYADRLKFNNKA